MEEKIVEILFKTILTNTEIEQCTKELLDLFSVSGSCDKLIVDIEKLKRFDDIAWEECANSTREYSSDGSCIDADELDEIINNYR